MNKKKQPKARRSAKRLKGLVVSYDPKCASAHIKGSDGLEYHTHVAFVQGMKPLQAGDNVSFVKIPRAKTNLVKSVRVLKRSKSAKVRNKGSMTPAPAVRESGKVLWFDERDGNGIIQDEHGSELYTDISAIKDRASLKDGQRVSFLRGKAGDVLLAKDVVIEAEAPANPNALEKGVVRWFDNKSQEGMIRVGDESVYINNDPVSGYRLTGGKALDLESGEEVLVHVHRDVNWKQIDKIEVFESREARFPSVPPKAEHENPKPRSGSKIHEGGYVAPQKEGSIDPYKFTPFTRQYLETALWSSSDDKDEPLDANYGIEDFSQEALAQAQKDCRDFQVKAESFLADYDEATAGHDFWLTRNHHGAGFWDGDYGKRDGEQLTTFSHLWPEIHVVVGDDGKLYFE